MAVAASWRHGRRGAVLAGGVLAIAAIAGMPQARAARLLAATPEGEIARVRQVVLKFSDPMVPLGDPQAAAPAAVSCTDKSEAKGTGRWQNERTWSFDFERELPAGVRCATTLRKDLRDAAGKPVDGRREIGFNTGGPTIVRQQPWGGEIEEAQHFQLVLNGPVVFESIERFGWCEARGINERVPLRIVQRDPLGPGGPALSRGATPVPPGQSVTVRCQRPLPAGVPVAVVWGKGIVGATGVARTTDQRLKYDTRPPFTASFSCERPQANAPCSPLSTLRLVFSAPVPRALAAAVELRGGKEPRRPVVEDAVESVGAVEFPGVHPERTDFTIVLPGELKDDSGRTLSNAGIFPLKLRVGDLPPLAKFPAAPFGILELNDDATLPISVRNVEADLNVRALAAGQAATVSSVRVTSEAQVLAWMRRLGEYHERDVEVGKDRRGTPILAQSRTLSLLGAAGSGAAAATPALAAKLAGASAGDVRRVPLPKIADGKRPFEVVGLPLAEPGYHVVEVESLMLGQALLERNAPMYVRTGALVTNLAVHFKQGRENALVWVTTLDRGKPVADAVLRVVDCEGKPLWEGRSDANGLARVDAELPRGGCGEFVDGLMVSARKRDERGREDFSFVLTGWNQGIESWRFNLPTIDEAAPTMRAHTVLDRSLLRAGETVSMKHLMRVETSAGLALAPRERLATHVRIVHQGSNQSFSQPIEWQQGRFAASSFRIPKEAKLGRYDVYLVRREAADAKAGANRAAGQGGAQDAEEDDGEGGPNVHLSGQFRVEEFRLPVLEGRLVPPKAPQVAVAEVPVGLQMNYLSGGPAAELPVEVSAMLRRRWLNFGDYEEYNFNLRESARGGEDSGEQGEGGSEAQGRVVADKLAVKLDANGAGGTTIRGIKPAPVPRDLVLEATFNDPNGETQTLSNTVTLYPAAVLVGVKTSSWVSVSNKLELQAVALDTAGKPAAQAPIEVRAKMVKRITTRKRLVGGLYGYDTRTEEKDLGVICSGRSDAKGLFACSAPVSDAGQMQLVAQAKDAQGQLAQADASVWVTAQGEVWFDAENQDRIDVLPEKKRYEPGQTAVFQVRMPFRHATALVSVEREGIVEASVVPISGSDPRIEVPVKAAWGPNVFVSVLAVRGRVREVPWYSLFTWGWRAPRDWWRERQGAVDFTAPTALVDLSKPAYKLGVAEIRVGLAGHELKVAVATDRERYQIREKARATIRVTRADGKPAPEGTVVAIAAVDQALLELQPNRSWEVLEAMYQRRGWGVQTSTAQMQVVGKRHYGRKALPPGGGGGRAPTRELFDTLLLWQPAVALNAKGEASVEVPLNDSLTAFRIVAVADAGEDLFGTGSTLIRSSQDLQIAAGLPPLVREDDRFVAMAKLRNGTDKPMKVAFAARSALGGHDASVDLGPGEAREVSWSVAVPGSGAASIEWELSAQDGASKAADRTKVRQRVVPAVPVTVQQATIVQLDGPFTAPVQAPAGAITGRGGLAVTVQSRLAEGLPGVRRYFEHYPFACLEQKTSKSIGLRDVALWQSVVEQMPAYLDDDGLAAYFPPYAGSAASGSDTLTAYLLSVTDEAAKLDTRYAIPREIRERLERGLIAFVEGRIKREYWSPARDVPARKLAALEALSRSGKVTPALVESIEIDPNAWPTGAVLDWYAVLARTPALPQRDARLAGAEQVLRARLSYQGTRLSWSTEADDHWWWLMVNGDVNSAKLLALAGELPAWKDDVPRLALGLLGRFKSGHWMTTNANLLGSLAIDNFSRRFENDKVDGQSAAVVRDAKGVEQARAFDWPPAGAGQGRMDLGWPAGRGTLALAHAGGGKPWATIQSLAAIPVRTPFAAGFKVEKKVEPVKVRTPGVLTRGDVLRVTLRVTPGAQATWVVVDDPVPTGATILGSGLGRDSQIDSQPSAAARSRGWDQPWIAYEERAFEAYRAYYQYVNARPFEIEYSLRLNNPGQFRMPATRVEAMYNPEMFGVTPNAVLEVRP
jgi:uncharacterized protein YfaS (alpha-2-macroglobulin family)